jgi:hypothetical protein
VDQDTSTLLEARIFGKARTDGHVLFRDSEGVTWEVHEVRVSPNSPWARGERCLLFRSAATIRRVWNYPAAWNELPAEELERLSWGT